MTKYKIKKGFIVQKLNNKITIFDSEKSVLYNFNETASFIFDKLKKQWDKKKIIGKLNQLYGVDNKTAGDDLNNLIRDLLSKKIISTA